VIVLKKAFRERDPGGRIRNATGWGANLQILSLAAPHARRIDEAAFAPVFTKRERPSRFRPVAALRGLFELRGTSWPAPQPTSEGEPAA
jgi:hypothetical protein